MFVGHVGCIVVTSGALVHLSGESESVLVKEPGVVIPALLPLLQLLTKGSGVGGANIICGMVLLSRLFGGHSISTLVSETYQPENITSTVENERGKNQWK